MLVDHAGQIEPLEVRPPGISNFMLVAVLEGLLGKGGCCLQLSGLIQGFGQAAKRSAAAAHRGEPIARVKIATERARAQQEQSPLESARTKLSVQCELDCSRVGVLTHHRSTQTLRGGERGAAAVATNRVGRCRADARLRGLLHR